MSEGDIQAQSESPESGRPADKASLRSGVIWNIASLAVLGASGMAMNVLIDVARGEEALGVFSQCFAFFIIISQIGVGGLQFSTLKHVSYVQDDLRQCRVIVLAALLLCSLLGVMICAGLYGIRLHLARWFESPELGVGLSWLLPGLFLFSLNKVFLMAVNGLNRMRAFALFQALRPICMLIGIGLVLSLGWSDGRLAAALSFAEGLVFVVLAGYVFGGVFRGFWAGSKEVWEWIRRHVHFGVRGFLSGILIELNTRVDVLMIGLVMPDAAVGVYAFGAVFAEGYAQLSNVIRQNIDPVIGKAFAKKRLEDIEECGRKIRRKFFPKMLLLGLGLSVCFPVFLLVLEKVFGRAVSWETYHVLLILVGGYSVAALWQPFIGLLLQGDRPGLFTLFIVGSVVGNILLNMLLIPMVGLVGAAFATGLVAILQGAGIAGLGRRLFGVRI